MKWIKLQARKIVGAFCLVLAGILSLIVNVCIFLTLFFGVCYMFLDEVARLLLKDEDETS